MYNLPVVDRAEIFVGEISTRLTAMCGRFLAADSRARDMVLVKARFGEHTGPRIMVLALMIQVWCKSGLLLLVLLCSPVLGQIPVEEAAPDGDTAAREKVETSVRSLEALYKSIQSKQGEIAAVQRELQASPDEVTRTDLLEQLTLLKEESARLNHQFGEFAVAVDISPFVQEPEREFHWQEELGAVLQPIIAEIKNATAESRVINELRSASEEQGDRAAIAGEAVLNLEPLLAAEPSPDLRKRLRKELAIWTQRRDSARNQQTALELQLENRLAERKSLLDSTTGYAETFFRTRGLNLVLGIGAFCLVFFGVRLLGGLYRRFHTAKRAASFTSRLGSILIHLFSVVGGMLAALLVFNMVGDWFLLGILVIFLLGLGWTGINTLPQHIETVNLMLNIGPVKEGERIVFDGIPWRVDRLSFGATLVNPLLDGGLQNMPVKHLVGSNSRPLGEHEEWFPSRSGDWVELADGRMGRVSCQTPSTVQLTELGGSQVLLQTPDYLALSPRNLSTGFRILTTFGIGYKHQPDSTTGIPVLMRQKLESGLRELVGEDLLRHVRVELSAAGTSSLDYEIEVDIAGAAAPRRPVIRRAVSRLLVDACNEHGWEIPFPQLTLHQA